MAEQVLTVISSEEQVYGCPCLPRPVACSARRREFDAPSPALSSPRIEGGGGGQVRPCTASVTPHDTHSFGRGGGRLLVVPILRNFSLARRFGSCCTSLSAPRARRADGRNASASAAPAVPHAAPRKGCARRHYMPRRMSRPMSGRPGGSPSLDSEGRPARGAMEGFKCRGVQVGAIREQRGCSAVDRISKTARVSTQLRQPSPFLSAPDVRVLRFKIVLYLFVRWFCTFEIRPPRHWAPCARRYGVVRG